MMDNKDMFVFLNEAPKFVPNKEHLEAEIMRQEFVRIFNKEKLMQLTIDDYALGQKDEFGGVSKDNFCYWVETKLNILGNMHGGTARKFGVYYDEDLKLVWTNWTKENFDNIRNALLELYSAGENENIKQIKENPLSPMFKGKILSLYFPHRYINVFADYHLVHFLDNLNVIHKGITEPIDLREKLITFKNSNPTLSSWTAIDFGHYLYKYFGAPSKDELDDNLKTSEEWYDSEQNVEIDRVISSKNDYRKYADRPVAKSQKIETPVGISYKRDAYKAVQALTDANFSCEIDSIHESFLRKDKKHKYMEAHHLIPMGYQEDFDCTLDTPANIISLCSHCHNLIHYGADSEKLLKVLYDTRIERLKLVGLEISFSDLKKYYK